MYKLLINVFHLQTQKTKTRQDPRLSFPPKNLRRPSGNSRTAPQGPKKTLGIGLVFMLPKKQRVSRKLFEAVFRSAATISSSFFVLKVKEASESKFAFSVSAKICPKAVDRNKLRRRGYAAARNLLPQIKTPTIFLFIAKKGAEKLSFQKLQEEIKRVLHI